MGKSYKDKKSRNWDRYDKGGNNKKSGKKQRYGDQDNFKSQRFNKNEDDYNQEGY